MVTSQTLTLKKGLAAFGSFLLWTLTAVLGVLGILTLREIVLSLYVLSLDTVPQFGDLALLAPHGYNRSYWMGVTLTQWTTLLSTILWIGIVIGGAEYLSRNYGTPKAWKFLGWVIGGEFVVLLVGLLI